MKALILTLLAVISIPKDLTPLQTPENVGKAQAYCEAYGGYWNLYSDAKQEVYWYECDEPDTQNYDADNRCTHPITGDDWDCDDLEQEFYELPQADQEYWGSPMCWIDGQGCDR